MFDDPYMIRMLTVSGSAFGLVLSLWMFALLTWNARQRKRGRIIAERMGLASGHTDGNGRVLRLWHDGREATTVVAGRTDTRTFNQRLDQMGRDAGWETPIQATMLGVTGAAR